LVSDIKAGVAHVDTYDNEDILTFARVWTGYDRQPDRGNVMAVYPNYLDPLQLKAELRDKLPKTKLREGYLGDAYPLCSELPATHYLLGGSTWQYTGNVSSFGAEFDTAGATLRDHLTPTPNASALHTALCVPEPSTGRCTFPVEVTLPATLPCHGDAECLADDVRIVRIVDPSDPENKTFAFYNHVPTRCVRMTFFNDGRVTKVMESLPQCADPTLPGVTGNACCDSANGGALHATLDSQCLFLAETMTLATAAKRCTAAFGENATLCSDHAMLRSGGTCAHAQSAWTTVPCALQLQVYPNGFVSMLEPRAGIANYRLAAHTGVQFRVRWNALPAAADSHEEGAAQYPTVAAGCDAGCHPLGHTCVCDLEIVTEPVFTTERVPADPAELRQKLKVGAHNPAEYGEGVYTKCTSSRCTSNAAIAVYTKGGSRSPSKFDADTIFEFVDLGEPRAGGGG
jgi:hypothetical protein